MPYSKNPDRYPPELAALLVYLQRPECPPEVRLDCTDEHEAHGRRIQIQSYFAALEHRAKEYEALAMRHIGKASANEAQALAETWQARAWTAAKWMVRRELVPPAVVLVRRTLSGGFGASLGQLLETVPQTAVPAPANPPTDLEAQMALLRQATANLDGK